MSATNQNALDFIAEWKNKGDEKQDSQKFWFSLFKNVLGVPNPENYLNFEQRVQLGHTSFMDVYIPQTKVIIEQKGKEIDLRRKAKQSDGQELTPFEQARRYNGSLPHSQKARWIVTCNFQTFLIYDMEEDPNGLTPLELQLEELSTKYHELKFLAEYQDQKIIEEQELSIKAGELIGKIYDLFKPQYKEPEAPNSLKSLNKLCVRLVFCLYAEDAGLFDRHDNHIFGNYLKKTETKHLRKALIELFTVLNQDPEKNERDPYLDEELARFPYVNGNLFKIESPETDEIPNFTDELKELLVEECSESFDWADISPTIFGALFESTLNPDTRRSGGMHYTSVENIHKVIDPLFLDDLKAEFDEIKQYKQEKKIRQECDRFQEKLASFKFLDPACGSGNFLTETYLCLRHLENEIITYRSGGSSFLGLEELNPVKVSISQFYGIEINDFAVAVANTALWIAESQMLQETERLIHREIDFLPLKTNSNIHVGNALRMDWEQIVPKSELNYIIGNPPFVGARLMTNEQKNDVTNLFDKVKGNGNLDYVACWYKKTAEYISNTKIEAALVSTNSICQGIQVPILWKFLYEKGIKINFAYRTFIWNSEALDKAHVHCVIIGFASFDKNEKTIFDETNTPNKARNINGYLLDSIDCFITERKQCLYSNVSPMVFGSMPNDGGNLFLTESEKEDLLKKYPNISEFIRPFLGADEFINNLKRYCFWLKDKDFSDFPEIIERVKRVKELRSASTRTSTKKLAETPALFGEIRQPKEGSYLLFPRHSSSRRKYIPIGFISSDIIAGDSNLIVLNASLFDFGILISSVHMAWTKFTCGRIKSDYRYSATLVYNNFVRVPASEEYIRKIEQTASQILEIRDKYLKQGKSLADLYGDNLDLVFTDLKTAHKANDKAVLALYGFKPDATEEEIVAKLMQMYAEKVKGE